MRTIGTEDPESRCIPWDRFNEVGLMNKQCMLALSMYNETTSNRRLRASPCTRASTGTKLGSSGSRYPGSEEHGNASDFVLFFAREAIQ